jgi:hypothetical protein
MFRAAILSNALFIKRETPIEIVIDRLTVNRSRD